jgi:hypothetical protein
MRILLDTNIFIPLEDSSINIDERLSQLNKVASGKHELLIHPATILDLKRDKNQERQNRIIPRLKKYSELEVPPKFQDSEEERRLFGTSQKDNDHIDNLILLALAKDCVHWLITEDNGIHKKEKLIGTNERVLTVDQAVDTLLKQESSYSVTYPNIEDILCYSLDIKNSFFDSLRESYDFDTWFKKCKREKRKAWICHNGDNIHAICIYNEENNPIVTHCNKSLRGKVLKLCTFKVARYGYKIGELFLKQAFNYAVFNNISHVYVTVEPNKHDRLEDLFSDFGFYIYGIENNGRDLVFVKDFPQKPPKTDDSPLEYTIKFFPFTKISTNSAHLVPIKPHYHQILFPEINQQTDLLSDINSAGNTIKKAYLCHASSNLIKKGDILFFYKSENEKSITSYGIVDEFYRENGFDNIMKWVSKRTVYDKKDIEELAKKDVKIILFRLIGHFDKYICFDWLISQKIVNGSIQSITNISNDKARKIIHEAKLNNRLLSD